jgi:hypothetical protein
MLRFGAMQGKMGKIFGNNLGKAISPAGAHLTTNFTDGTDTVAEAIIRAIREISNLFLLGIPPFPA